jgi:hypothetical protein
MVRPVRRSASRFRVGIRIAPIDITIVCEPIPPAGAIEVRVDDGALAIAATGALNFEKGKTILARPTSNSEFLVDDDDHTRLAFVRDVTEKNLRRSTQSGALAITATKVN